MIMSYIPAHLLESITDAESAIKAVNELTNIMTSEQKASPTGIDLATLYAETASAKAASTTIDSSIITQFRGVCCSSKPKH